MRNWILFTLIIVAQLAVSCKSEKGTAATAPSTTGAPGRRAHAVVYKTKADYSTFVPVTLSRDKSKIVSYPAPTDVFYRGKLATPTILNGGYLLDNRGVNPNSAFINMTYEEYSKLPQAPTLIELYQLIIDKSPFTEMYDLGQRNTFTDEQKEINTIIKASKLRDYRKVI